MFSVANHPRTRFKNSASATAIKHRSLVAFQEASPLLFLPTLIEAPYNLRDLTPFVSLLLFFSDWPHYCSALAGALGLWRSLCFYCAGAHRVYVHYTRTHDPHRRLKLGRCIVKRQYQPRIPQTPMCIFPEFLPHGCKMKRSPRRVIRASRSISIR